MQTLVSQLISSSRTYDNNYVFPNKELYITFSWIPLKGKSNVVTVPTFNRLVMEEGKIDTPNTRETTHIRGLVHAFQ